MKKIMTGCVGIVLSLWLNGIIKEANGVINESLSNAVTDATRATIESGALDPYPDAKFLLSLVPVLILVLSVVVCGRGFMEMVRG